MSVSTPTTVPARGGTADEYEQFCVAFRRVCGIDLLQYKRGQMERRIRSFVATRGADVDLLTYAGTLKGDKDELNRFLDRVTINVSQLWRNPEQWAILEEKILPDLASTAPTHSRVRCWSAGSSYGAEAYTLAAIARRAIPRATVSILGTDIDARMVDRARTGIFSGEDARDAPTATLASHFEMADGQWHASAELKRLVRFEQGDLLRIHPAADSFDLVLCRNTVIYFNEDVRDALHGRLAASLRAGGRLVVGATERVSDPVKHDLEPESPFVYRKI
jgi:chemotaxis protein methyltransferase CheR